VGTDEIGDGLANRQWLASSKQWVSGSVNVGSDNGTQWGVRCTSMWGAGRRNAGKVLTRMSICGIFSNRVGTFSHNRGAAALAGLVS